MEDFGLNEIIFIGVILSRMLVPLLIIRFPLPAIVACLIIDAVDQTVFSALAPEADLTGYQNYDKALDIYYLVIAYIATLRNWTNPFALGVARFLIYYRLIGVALFELTGIREVLFIFPNTFEYFFIFYESVRLFWDPRRMSNKLVVGAAAFIWIFIKLPQEYWIHIAQLDLTDFVQEDIFGVAAGTSWIDTFAARPWIVVIAVVVVAALIYAAYWIMKNKLPPRDRPLTIDADAEPDREVPAERLDAERAPTAGDPGDARGAGGGASRRHHPQRGDSRHGLVPRERTNGLGSAGAVRPRPGQSPGPRQPPRRLPPAPHDQPAQGRRQPARGGATDRRSAAGSLAPRRARLGLRGQLGLGRGLECEARKACAGRDQRRHAAHLRRQLASCVPGGRLRRGRPTASRNPGCRPGELPGGRPADRRQFLEPAADL